MSITLKCHFPGLSPGKSIQEVCWDSIICVLNQSSRDSCVEEGRATDIDQIRMCIWITWGSGEHTISDSVDGRWGPASVLLMCSLVMKMFAGLEDTCRGLLLCGLVMANAVGSARQRALGNVCRHTEEGTLPLSSRERPTVLLNSLLCAAQPPWHRITQPWTQHFHCWESPLQSTRFVQRTQLS